MKITTAILALILSTAFVFADAPIVQNSGQPDLSKAALVRKTTTTQLREFAESALIDLQLANVRWQSASEQKGLLQTELASAHNRFDAVYSWGIGENARANDASVQYWNEKAKHKETLHKLFIWRCLGSVLAFAVVFLLVVQFTQYLLPPYSFLIPVGIAMAASAGVWLFL